MSFLRIGTCSALLCAALMGGLSQPVQAATESGMDSFVFVDVGRASGGDTGPGFGAGLRWANGFGVEGSWQKLDEFDVISSFFNPLGGSPSQLSVNQVEGKSTALFLSFRQPLSDTVSLTALAGAHHWRYSHDFGSHSGDDPALGLRLDLVLDQNWQTGLAVQHFEVGPGDVQRVSAQLSYHF